MSPTLDPAADTQAPLTPERMQRMHLTLLNEAQDADLPPGEDGRSRVRSFVDRVAASGGLLDGAVERRAAQGILDYWVACLNMALGPEASAPVSARLKAFDKDALAAIVARLDALPAAEQALAVPLLAALVEPDERDQMRAVAHPRAEWLSGLPPAAASTADRLVELGAVTQFAPPDSVVELASGALIRLWAPLARAIAGRAQLRERARMWEKAGKADPSIFAKAPDGAERSLIARDDLERSYVKFRDRLVRQRVAVAVVMAVLLAAMGIVSLVLVEKRRADAALAGIMLEHTVDKTRRQEAEQQLSSELAQKEPIRQAIATHDAKALADALRNDGIAVPEDVLAFVSPAPASAEPEAASPVRQSSPDPSAGTNADDVCKGAIWVGADGRSYLRDAPALDSDQWTGRGLVTTANLRLRRSTPDPVRGQPEAVGVIPAGTAVVAQGRPVLDPTARTPVYFLPITTAGPNCMVVYPQYAGQRAAVEALAKTLDDIGYTMRAPAEVRLTPGLAEVRYYHGDDAARARGLGKRVREALDRAKLLPGQEIQVRDLTAWPRAKPPPGTVELWLDLSGGAAGN